MPFTSLPLRERRRRQTELEIHRATLHLAVDVGFSAVTAELIAAKAGISVRTFFNYYPNKLAAAVGPALRIEDAALARFLNDGEPLLEAATRLLCELLAEHGPDRETMRIIFTLSETTPELTVAFLSVGRQTEAELTAAILHRIANTPPGGCAPGCPDSATVGEANLIARLMMQAFEIVIRHWALDERMDDAELGQILKQMILSACKRLGSPLGADPAIKSAFGNGPVCSLA